MSRFNSPPVTTTGRRMRTQRGSTVPVLSSRRMVASLSSMRSLRCPRRRLVDGLVVDRDDAVFGEEGVGDVDFAAGIVHEIADGAGDGGLAVAGRAVDEHRLAADDGRADGVEQLVADDQVGESGAQRFRAAVDAGDRLAIGLLDVIFDRHRGGADVGALLHRILGAAPAQFGQVEAIADPADQIAAGDLDALLVLEKAERLLDHLERQAEEAGQVQAEHAAVGVKRAQDQVVEEAEASARLPSSDSGAVRISACRCRPIP